MSYTVKPLTAFFGGKRCRLVNAEVCEERGPGPLPSKRARQDIGVSVTVVLRVHFEDLSQDIRVKVLDRDPSWDEPVGREVTYLGEYEGKAGLVFEPCHVFRILGHCSVPVDADALTPIRVRTGPRLSVSPLESGLGSALVSASGEVQLIVPEDSCYSAHTLAALLNAAADLEKT